MRAFPPVRFFWSLLFPLLLLLTLGCAGAGQGDVSGRVSWVHDGDTLKVDGIGTVRMIGVDVPETAASERDQYLRRQGVAGPIQRQTAKKALHFVIGEAKGKTVRLRFDGDRQDRHGRALAYVLLPDGRNLNRLLIEEGMAAVYRRFDFQLKKEFLAAEKEARDAGRGMWKK
ncbi:MAG: thermonuclease family protein [Trichloromonas sp.]|jgi:micrococcal nuclease|nr:thermonuclease family protein [Trichloromonas sp.]